MFQTIFGHVRIYRDPEARSTPQGDDILEIQARYSRPVGHPKEGEDQKWESTFYKFTFWKDQAKRMAEKDFRKGDHVVFQGTFRPNAYIGKDRDSGQDVAKSTIEMFYIEKFEKFGEEVATQGDFKAAPEAVEDKPVFPEEKAEPVRSEAPANKKRVPPPF